MSQPRYWVREHGANVVSPWHMRCYVVMNEPAHLGCSQRSTGAT